MPDITAITALIHPSRILRRAVPRASFGVAALALAAALACAILWNAASAPEASAHGSHPHSQTSSIESCAASPSSPNPGDTVTLSASVDKDLGREPNWESLFPLSLNLDEAVDGEADMYVVFKFYRNGREVGRLGSPEDIRRVDVVSNEAFRKRIEARAPHLPAGATTEVVCSLMRRFMSNGAATYREQDHTGATSKTQNAVIRVRAPAPADDHSDSLSRATRATVGSSVSGVIGTENDLDYFSFQARRGREYTIETRIASGSRVDTTIWLVSGNGSALASNDNGGAGRASKIVWTARSSATHYVLVSGGGTTGGYRLSLSSRVPSPPPAARVSTTGVPRSATVGRSFEFDVELRNGGGDGDHGGVSVSFPSLSGGSKSSNSYSSSRADVRAVSYTGGRSDVSLYKTGDSINRSNGARMSARHLLIESDDSTWRSSTRRVLTLRVTPKRAGEFRFMVRGWICADRYSNCSRSPTSGSSDQQGYRASVRTVNVTAAAAPAPADAHGDSRSRATRVTVGSSVSGVIGTADDMDFFSFQARRGGEYTIETRAASGSRVDTLIGLFSAADALLSYDDDSGSGRASKVVWTAPSSAVYYVLVMGDSDSTGGYRLSVSERARTPEPPAPAAAANGPIAFASERDGNWEIYAMNADGSGVVRLTNNSATDRYPSWSPDGRRIAFSSYRDGNWEIYAMNADGSGVVRLTNNSATDRYPSWSPDGRRIAFSSYRDGNDEIYAMNADGSGVTRLTNRPNNNDYYPRWSPAGGRIAFFSYHGSDNREIYAMNADGSGLSRLTNNSTHDLTPSWSPDGRRIAFISNRSGGWEIYAMNADGSGVVRLTNNSSGDWNTSWSPDGRRIAFESNRDGNWEVYAMNADGSNQTRLTRNSVNDWNASWGPSTARVGGGVPAPSTPADDHGDRRSSATRVTAGSSASGVLGTHNDVDYFSFRAERGREYTIEMTIASGSRVDAALTLYAANGSRLADAVGGGSGRASKIVWTAPSSGTYYVAAHSILGMTGGYRLSVSERARTPAPPADDHGDRRSSATRVTVGASAPGVIGTSSDLDVFSFRASRNLEYTIQTGIVSGSSVDTFITLYDANALRLVSDNDGGNGRASKIVWTAPSSATYYVGVEGRNGSTGGYWLSVTERAQAPAPVPNISRFSVPNAAPVGQSFDISFELRNDGGDGERGGLSVSFPSLTGGSKSSGGYSSSLADVRVVDYTSGTGNVSLYKSGDSINHANGSAMRARHLLIESDDASWRSNTRRVLTLRVTPKRAGDLPVRVRGWICADRYSSCSRAPTYGTDDQQGYDTAWASVLVVAPAPTDDHGDNRSSATRISAGSGASGVIGTANDVDVFSFRAERGTEYTIEMSRASGSNVDTRMALYAADGSRPATANARGRARPYNIVWTAPSSGNYYVEVGGRNGSTGDYRLSLSARARTPEPPTPQPSGDDHGDGISSATRISVGSTVSAAFETDNDEDYFSFQARSGREYTIETSVASGSGLNTRLVLLNADGGLVTYNDDGGVGNASKIVWTATSSGTYYVSVDHDSASATGYYRLSLTERAQAQPSGAGGRIAFGSRKDGDFEIYAMNADGSGLVQLTDNRRQDFDPSWSPDGRRIAFVSEVDGNREIFAMSADGSNQTRLTNSSANDHDPSWSPDGRRIAFTSERNGNQEIYAMNADGSGVVRLTNNSARDSQPSWSPDGRRIAFVSERDGNREIYAMNADGSNQTRLTNRSAADATPSWSPDGRRIAFASNRDGNWEIYAMSADGSNQTRLTNRSSSIDVAPSWSPDGRRIAFESEGGGSDEIYAMNADGSGVRRLTGNSVDVWGPSWVR